MKTFLRLIILLLMCGLLGLWSPWFQLDIDISSLFNVEKPEPISGLEVYSLLGDLEVYIDDVLQEGSASAENGPLFIDGLTPGEKAITIIRKSEVEGAYWQYRDIITFVEGVNTVISLGIGPEEEFSEGTFITATERNNEEYNLRIRTNLNDYQLNFDGSPFAVDGNEFTRSIDLNSQHTVRINKTGYEELEFTILPEDQSARDTLKDFIINVEVQLMVQPVEVE